MAMRQRFTCELLSYSSEAGDWELVETWDEVFSRRAPDVARAVLESWIISHPERLVGGERISVTTELAEDEPAANATLRVDVFPGGKETDEDEPAAVGFLGHDARDFTGEHPRI